MKNSVIKLYESLIYSRPVLVLIITAIVVALLTPFASNFRLDASSDSLVLENDTSLKYYNEVVSKYNTADFLVLTYSPNTEVGDLFSKPILDDLEALQNSLLKLERTQSIVSILNAPLTQSPPLTLNELAGKLRFLRDQETDLTLAKKELRDSDLYRDLLVSKDFSTTALAITLKRNPEVSALLDRRNELRRLKADQLASAADLEELEQVTLQHQQAAAEAQKVQDQYIVDVRDLILKHNDKATMFLGGLPMIVTDSMSFIQGDVVVFGTAAIVIIILILAIAFRQFSWVVMPLIICFTTAYLVVCLLGLLNWPISVVSSNFLSLLLIITLSLNIHLIVRYRELGKLQPNLCALELVRETVRSKFTACLYTSITTMVAFASLIVSGIRPVMDFGYIMCLGIIVSIITTFVLFPSLALLMKPKPAKHNRDGLSKVILNGAESAYKQVSFATVAFVTAAAIAVYGLMNLTVENRFIDYFSPDTEIYQGMYEIDSKLGGTTPLDIIIDAPASFLEQQLKRETELANNIPQSTTEQQDLSDFDDFEDEIASSAQESDSDFDDFDDFGDDSPTTESDNLAYSSYWFNVDGIDKVRAIQASLEAMPETGKVMSLGTSMSIFNNLKDSKPLDNLDLGLIYNLLSDDLKKTLFTPYISVDANQLHISIRVFESHKGLNRNQLIEQIRSMLINEHGIADEQINISGMLVLYNNMLNSLFESQILTLGTVFLVIMLMFVFLFMNFRLALITIIPNAFSAAFVLGLMGIFSIPLDLMTITIAAITVGIAVDNAIHYVSRFRDEYRETKDYKLSIDAATQNIGQAMFYTTLVITAGFLIMLFSNFVPTVYFGILTAVAMVTALIANLVMLPMLLAKFKPLG